MNRAIDLSLAMHGLPLSGLAPVDSLARTLELCRGTGCKGVQLDGAAAGLRARELDRSARRDIAATLKRWGIGFSGLDLWVPEAHFADPARVDGAVAAVAGACGLAGELERLVGSSGVEVALTLPAEAPSEVVDAIDRAAASHGVRVADYGPSGAERAGPALSGGVDPAVGLAGGEDVLGRINPGVRHARLSDANRYGRVAMGDGGLDVPAYRAVLATVSAVRWVVVDVRGLPDPIRASVAAAEAWGES